MKDKDLKSRLKSLELRRPSSSYVDKVLAQKPERLEAQIEPRWYGRRIWIYGAIAAAVLVLVMVRVVQFWPGGEPRPGSPPVKDTKTFHSLSGDIPLEEVPLEDLLKLHFTYNDKTIAGVVKEALDKLSAREVLDIAWRYGGQGGTIGDISVSAEMVVGLPPALSRVIGASEFVVRGRVEQVILDVSDIKAAILQKKLDAHWFEHHGAMVKAEVQLEVFEAYPSLPALDGENLTLWPVLHTRRLDVFENGKEYLIALQQDGDIIWTLPYTEGVYPVDANNGMVSGFRSGEMPLDDAWLFIMDLYDAIHAGIEPAGETLEYWLAKLQSEDLMECWTAVEYFNALAAPPVAAELVMAAIERHYGAIVQTYRENKYIFRWRAAFLKDMLDLLARVGDNSTVDRMLALYEKDRTSAGSIFNEEPGTSGRGFSKRMVRLAVKYPGPRCRERFLQVLANAPERGLEAAIEELKNIEGEGINSLLFDMLKNPGSFGISHAHHLRAVWNALARRGSAEIGPYLMRFIADPQNTDLGVKHYNNNPREAVHFAYRAYRALALLPESTVSAKEFLRSTVDSYCKTRDGSSLNLVVNTMDNLLEPGDMEFNSLLGEIVTSHWKIPILIAERVPDPCFVPVLRQALKEQVTDGLIRALYACGAQQEAVEIALSELEKPVDDKDWSSAYRDFQKRAGIIGFLGKTGDRSLLPIVEEFTHGEVLGPYREINSRLGGGGRDYSINAMQQNAVLAFARLGGESAMPRLKELYESEDMYIKILAAVALYALDDDTGYELLEHFINHTERSVPEIEMRWHIDMHGGRPFEEAVRYLKSPRTDALLQERRQGTSAGIRERHGED